MTTRILLVDDFEQWRFVVRSMLEDAPGFQVIGEASDGLEAIEKAVRLRPDLVLLDVEMPNLNGIEAAKKIMEANRKTEVIFLTVNGDEEVRSAALATGAIAYLLKSKAVRDLLPTIETLLFGEVATHEPGSHFLQ